MKTFNQSEIIKLVLLWLMFTATAPFYFHYAIPYHPYKIIVFLGLLYMLLLMFNRNSIQLGNKVIISIFVIQTIYSLLAALLQSTFLGVDMMYFNLSIQLVAVTIVYLYVYTFFNIHKLSISTIYVLVLMGSLGFIAFILGLLGMLKPISIFPFDNPTYANFILTFSNAYHEVGNGFLIRISGYFGEPGSFAHYLTMVILINKLYDYSKKLEFALIFLGVFTLSLAFFVSISLYILFFYTKIKYAIFIMFLLLIAVTSFFAIDKYKDDIPIVNAINHLTLGRLEQSDDDVKLFAGDNRTQKFLYSKDAFFKSPYIGHGLSAYGNPKSEFHGKLCCNILDPLATHGIIGVLIFYMLFFYWLFIIFDFKKGRIDYVSLGVFLIIFANFFQRPGFYSGLFGYFMYIFLVEASIWRAKKLTKS